MQLIRLRGLFLAFRNIVGIGGVAVAFLIMGLMTIVTVVPGSEIGGCAIAAMSATAGLLSPDRRVRGFGGALAVILAGLSGMAYAIIRRG